MNSLKRFATALLALLYALSAATSHAPGQVLAPDCQGDSCNWPPPNAPRRALPAEVTSAIVRVYAYDARGGRNGVSGALVLNDGRAGVVITCAHVLDDGGTRFHVVFADGTAFEARLLGADNGLDLAAFQIAAPRWGTIDVEDSPPGAGDVITSYGFGSNNRLAGNEGRVVQYVGPLGGTPGSILEISGASRSGDSGGPMLNTSYRLVAVSHGSNGRVVDGTHCGHVRNFLHRLGWRLRHPLQPPRNNPYNPRYAGNAPAAADPWRPAAPDNTNPYPARPQRVGNPTNQPAPPSQPELQPPLVELPPPPQAQPRAPDPDPALADRLRVALTEVGRLQALHAEAETQRDKLRGQVDELRAQARGNLAAIGQLKERLGQREGELAAVGEKLKQALERVKAAAPNGAMKQANNDAAPNVTLPSIPAGGPDLLNGPVERIAERAGQAWLTTLLVGLGLPAGPAGIAAGLGASALVGAGGLYVRSRFKKLRGQLDQARTKLPTDGLALPDGIADAVRKAASDALELAGAKTAPPAPQDKGSYGPTYNLSSDYADDLAAKRANQGMTLGQQGLLAQIQQEALLKLRNGDFRGEANLAQAMEHWIMGQFLKKHNVRTTLDPAATLPGQANL